MPEKHPSMPDEVAEHLVPGENKGEVVSYSVILDSIRSEIETVDSFALKLSVLLKQPVTKVKHMVRRLPGPLWKVKSAAKARKLLELIGEAGGVAHIEENHAAPAESAQEEKQAANSCSKCGFPLNASDEYCSFCMTPLNESKKKSVNIPAVAKSPSIPPARLLLYLIVLFAGVIMAFALR